MPVAPTVGSISFVRPPAPLVLPRFVAAVGLVRLRLAVVPVVLALDATDFVFVALVVDVVRLVRVCVVRFGVARVVLVWVFLGVPVVRFVRGVVAVCFAFKVRLVVRVFFVGVFLTTALGFTLGFDLTRVAFCVTVFALGGGDFLAVLALLTGLARLVAG